MFVSLNCKSFEGLLMPQVSVNTMDSHTKMLQPGSWASQVEVIAAATYLQVPVYYVAYQEEAADVFKWQ